MVIFMKIIKLSKIYTKLYLSKSSIISLIISSILILIYVFYHIIDNSSNYFIYYEKININYLDSSFNILKISLVFIILFLIFREANLLQDSFDVMIESSSGRNNVFIAKQITLISLVVIISLLYFLILYCPIYYVYKLFKLNLLKSYLTLLLFLIETLEVALFINYLFKNSFISLLFGLILVIKGFVNNNVLDYLIPTLVVNQNISFNVSIYYVLCYIILFTLLNYIIYIKFDRK